MIVICMQIGKTFHLWEWKAHLNPKCAINLINGVILIRPQIVPNPNIIRTTRPRHGLRSWSGKNRQANLRPVRISDLHGNGQYFTYWHLHKSIFKIPIRLPAVDRKGSKPKTDKRERQINTETKKLISEFSNPVQRDQLHSTSFHLKILINPPKPSA